MLKKKQKKKPFRYNLAKRLKLYLGKISLKNEIRLKTQTVKYPKMMVMLNATLNRV